MSSQAIDTSSAAGFAEYTVNASQVEEAVADLIIDCSEFDATWWDNVASDGSDIRVTNAAGDTAYSFHVSADFNTTTKIGKVWFNAVGLSTSEDTTYRVYVGDPSWTMPSVSATLGRNNVWQSSTIVYWAGDHAGAQTDLTGNGNTGSVGSSPTLTDANIGKGVILGDGDYFFDNAMSSPFDVYQAMSISCLVDITSATSPYIGSISDGSTTNDWWGLQCGVDGATVTFYSYPNSGSNKYVQAPITGNGFYHAGAAQSSVNVISSFFNGAETQNTDSGGWPASCERLAWGMRYRSDVYTNPGRTFVGQFFRIDDVSRSAAWMETHANNQVSPTSFATYSAWGGDGGGEEGGGGSVVTTRNKCPQRIIIGLI